MNEFASATSESVKRVGQAFLVAYYLPALTGVLLHLYLLIPIWVGTANLSLTKSNELILPFNSVQGGSTGQLLLPLLSFLLLVVIILPFLTGIVLFGVNNLLIRMFEGRVWWLEYGLLYPLQRINRQRCKQLYGHLSALQREYRRVSNLMLHTPSENQRESYADVLESLRVQIDKEHDSLERSYQRQLLPHATHRVAPTSFGNAYAIAEEYAYERYGIDSVLFWPRLRELMQDLDTSQLERITHQKTVLDLSINFGTVFALITLEAVFTVLFVPTPHDGALLLTSVLGVLLFTCFYSASVGAVRTLGQYIMSSFDFHRDLVLRAFNLAKPDSMLTEQIIWVRLAAFIRRGEEFYFPQHLEQTLNPALRVDRTAEALSTPSTPPDCKTDTRQSQQGV